MSWEKYVAMIVHRKDKGKQDTRKWALDLGVMADGT